MSVGTGRRPPTLPQLLGPPDILAVIGAVLEIIAGAWERVRQDGVLAETHRHDEPATAGLLRQRMVVVERERSPRIPNLKIKPEVGVTAEDGQTVVGSIDIEVIYSLGDEPDFRLECKRVSSMEADDPAGLARYYVGHGVLRFVGKYGWGHTWGMMIGFAIDGNSEAAALLIARYVKEYKNEPSHLLRDWAEEKRFGAYPYLFNTLHRKSGDSEIELLHLFLPFSAAVRRS